MARRSQSNTLENNMNNTTKGMPGSNNNGSKEKTENKQTLNGLFEKALREAYSCEKQLIDVLAEMAKNAYSEELQDAFKEHKEQTQRHLERIEKIYDRLHIASDQEETNKVIETLFEIGKKVITEYEKSPLRDSSLIIVAQKVEHVEIALYGSLCELADVLGYHKVIDILERTLEEEKMTDERLTDIAREVNDEAFEMAEELQEY